MSIILDQTGLTIESLNDIVAALNAGLRSIYGADINLDPNSPDGQLVALVAQAKEDMEELLAQVYASMDPDQAIGVVLDQRCAINGVVRHAGTYTQQSVAVTVTQAVTLPGIDTAPTAPFTVADTAGNQYQLKAAHVFTGSGSASLVFQAAKLGTINSAPNTITSIVSVTLGVSTVNNAAGPSTTGTTEESDSALRVRRANSVSLPSRGYLQGLIGALQDVDGVTQAEVFENNTSSPSGGIAAHSIWCIVAGGALADIANAIYVKRNAGCGMVGSTTVPVTQVDGTIFTVAFDRPTPETLWVQLTVAAITGAVDPEYVRAQILSEFATYRINQTADASAIVAFVKGLVPNASVSGEGVSANGVTYAATLAPAGVNYNFTLASVNLIINGAAY